MKYRRAERTLRYPVYLALEWLWAIVALIGIANEFRPSGVAWLIATALAALAIVHSVKMTTLHPWLALKSILFGVAIFGVLVASNRYLGYPVSPLVIAAILASAHYLWTGEQWTAASGSRAGGYRG